MLTLGIETSCDETALALVQDGKLISEALASQVDVHALFGGVVPEIASREHLRLLPVLYKQLMERTGVAPADLDCISVARGPGLLGSLLMGVSFAKGLCLGLNKPLVGVNHLHAHLLASGLEQDIAYPALGLLVSGGHTHIYLVKSPSEFELLGKTLDDAAGEAFDKVAKALNFPYPGGQYIDKLAQGTEPDRKLFPRPYISNDNLDFSFSGVKTAVANYIQKNPELVAASMYSAEQLKELLEASDVDEKTEHLRSVCSSFNWCVAETLRIKMERALKRVLETTKVESILVAGGVAANTGVRASMTSLSRAYKIKLILPSLQLCTDNAAMIAYTGQLLFAKGFRHDLTLEAIPRGRAVPEDWVS
ncbi:MAG: tRNA (adenosine(37)-N6)-threonylcarbamoyltransferase complex transferase subunit TsaD [Desulfovibrio sp.]